MSEFWSHNDQITYVANSLEILAGPHCGDIYLTALDLFSHLAYPRRASIDYRDDIDYMAGGRDEFGNVVVEISTHPGVITPEKLLHINERFQLSEDQQFEEIYVPIMVAHEFAHTVQEDEQFATYFGKLADDHLDSDEDFAGYVNTDAELNADYIAAVIVGNSQLGQAINFMPPTESPLQWREWASAHPIPKTIALDLANRRS